MAKWSTINFSLVISENDETQMELATWKNEALKVWTLRASYYKITWDQTNNIWLFLSSYINIAREM